MREGDPNWTLSASEWDASTQRSAHASTRPSSSRSSRMRVPRAAQSFTGAFFAAHTLRSRRSLRAHPSLSLSHVDFRRLAGPRSAASVMALHPFFPILISCEGNAAFNLWDLETKALLCTHNVELHRHPRTSVKHLAINPSSGEVATVHTDNSVCVWNLNSKESSEVWAGGRSSVNALVWSSSGAELAVGFSNGQVEVRCPRTGWTHHTVLVSEREVNAIVSLPHDNMLAVGSSDWMIRIFEGSTLEQVSALEGHLGPVTCLAASDRFLVSGSLDNTVRVWPAAFGISVGSTVVIECSPYAYGFRSLLWRDSTLVAVRGSGTTSVWDTSDRDPEGWIERGDLRSHHRAVVVLGGNLVACASTVDNISVWDVSK